MTVHLSAPRTAHHSRRFVQSALAVAVMALIHTVPPAIAQANCEIEPAEPVPIQGNAVTHWNAVAEQAIVVARPPGSSAVLEGILQAAIYDATIAIEGGYEPFVATPPVTGPASTAAAIAQATCEVLVQRVPGQAAYANEQYDRFMATIPDGVPTSNGIAVGSAVAAAILHWRAGDGFDAVIPWVQPPPGPGVFEPVPIDVTPPPTPVDVKLTQVRPLTLASNSQFRPDGPNPLASPGYAEDFDEVKAYGRIDSDVRTTEQTQTAWFWSENSAMQWPRNLRSLAIAQGLDLAGTARMLAMAQVATADAILACFDAKYHYLRWRPVHAIVRADTDGNPATSGDPTWRPLLNVNHPEYPGAHGCWTKAVTVALASFFGTDRVAFSMDSLAPNAGPPRSYDSFRHAAREVYDARTWAGLHFRNSTMEGAWIGKKVANLVESFFQPTSLG